MPPRLTSFAPQFLVADLERSIAYYQKLGFTFGAPWAGFYAIGQRDGLELHLKAAPANPAERQYRRAHEHLDAAAGDGDPCAGGHELLGATESDPGAAAGDERPAPLELAGHSSSSDRSSRMAAHERVAMARNMPSARSLRSAVA